VKVLFLDESGNHALTTVDPDYPVFVLGGIITDLDYAQEVIDERIRHFKLDLFGRDDLILHTADIARNKNGFERLVEPVFRRRFYAELNQLMAALEYQVVACAIRKDTHLARYGLAALDPYLLSLDVLVERFCFAIGNVPGGGVIYAEKRSPVLDRELDIAWLNLKLQGTQRVRASTVDERITALLLRPKDRRHWRIATCRPRRFADWALCGGQADEGGLVHHRIETAPPRWELSRGRIGHPAALTRKK
jgi:hypothetical protein